MSRSTSRSPAEPAGPTSSGLLYLFISQIITDVCLALYYLPSADHAHTAVLALIASRIPMDLGTAANPADTRFLPRPEWYYRPAFQALKYLSGRASLLGILLPALLAMLFALVPFLDRSLERRPWRRPIVIGSFLLFLVAYVGLGFASYHDDYSDPAMAAQMHEQDQDAENFMKQPFVPEAAAGSVSAALASADPRILKGQALYQAGSCASCHGDRGVGTAAAPALTGAAQKYSEVQLASLLRKPSAAMTGGGMMPVDLKDEDLGALVAYLRQLH